VSPTLQPCTVVVGDGAARYSSSWDGCVCVFDPASAVGSAVASIPAHAGPVYEVAVSGSDNNTVVRW
jgi:hypothetical protein